MVPGRVCGDREGLDPAAVLLVNEGF